HVQDDQVRAVLLDHHAGVEAVAGDADLEPAVFIKHLDDQLDQLGVVVDEQDLALAAFEGLGRDAVILHELVQGLPRDAAEPRSGHAEALELSVVETTDDGLLADFADLGGLAGREHGLHAYVHPLNWSLAERAGTQFARDRSGVAPLRKGRLGPGSSMNSPQLAPCGGDVTV